jgi:16S rRNA (guanine527-N7)-methyltransferase
MSRPSHAAGFDAAARLAAAASELGVELNSHQQAKLLQYVHLLDRWSKTYNLSAIRGEESMLTHHVLDSLAIVPALARWAGGRIIRALDVGSGAGLPGVVMAIARADWFITTVDSVGKKSAFVRQAAGELGLSNLVSRHERVELMTAATAFDLIVSRAFATLSEFTELTQRCLAPGGVWVAMKGRVPIDEIAKLPGHRSVFHVEQLVVPGLGAERCLVWIRPN